MRTAAICPTCATYVNSVCVIYNGEYLSNINASPKDNLDTILGNIDDTVKLINLNISSLGESVTELSGDIQQIDTRVDGIDVEIDQINQEITLINNRIYGILPIFGEEDPTMESSFIGQLYINTYSNVMFFSSGTGINTVWNPVCGCSPSGSRIFDQTFDLTFN
jgi:hypothetical protein